MSVENYVILYFFKMAYTGNLKANVGGHFTLPFVKANTSNFLKKYLPNIIHIKYDKILSRIIYEFISKNIHKYAFVIICTIKKNPTTYPLRNISSLKINMMIIKINIAYKNQRDSK